MVQPKFEAFRNVQNASRQAVVPVRDFLGIDFNRLAAGKKRHFVFLRGGFVLDFFDVWICSAHNLLSKDTSKDAGLEPGAKLPRACALPTLTKRRCPSAPPPDAPSHDSTHQCACG